MLQGAHDFSAQPSFHIKQKAHYLTSFLLSASLKVWPGQCKYKVGDIAELVEVIHKLIIVVEQE